MSHMHLQAAAGIKQSKESKPKKFDFEELRVTATSSQRSERKAIFLEYFERFHEYPSYLFDNEREIDADLWQTAQDILADSALSREVKKGVDDMLNRLPFRQARS